jgi:hypothetical protein
LAQAHRLRAVPRPNLGRGGELRQLVGVPGALGVGHSLTFRTSPRRSASDRRVSVSRRCESAATWFAGITPFTASTALARATAAAQSDLLPSGAVTSTMGILVRTFAFSEYAAPTARFPARKSATIKLTHSPRFRFAPNGPIFAVGPLAAGLQSHA